MIGGRRQLAHNRVEWEYDPKPETISGVFECVDASFKLCSRLVCLDNKTAHVRQTDTGSTIQYSKMLTLCGCIHFVQYA